MIEKGLWAKGIVEKRKDSCKGELFLASLVQQFLKHVVRMKLLMKKENQ